MRASPNIVRAASLRGRLFLAVVCVLVLYVLVPQIEEFSESLSILKDADLFWVILAMPLLIATYVCAAGTYVLLAFKLLPFGRTWAIQGASAFTNRLLPAGLGGLTLNVAYLRRQKHSLPQAIVVAGANNTIGMMGHILLLTALVVWNGSEVWPRLTFHIDIGFWYFLAGILLLAAIAVAAFERVRRRVRLVGHELVQSLRAYRKRSHRLLAALGSSLTLTTLVITIFYVTGQAVGMDLSFAQVMVVFTVGLLAGTVTPTPGGLGGVEAGLVAGSIAYGVEASVALAAALLYRLLTYWLPLIPGFILFLIARKRYL